MQAILMAAGKGTRLGSMTADIPKSFVEIKGKKLIDININMLKKHGINDIVIVTGCHADMFEKKFADHEGIKLVYNPFYGFTNVIGSFFMGMNELKDDFIYMHADTLCAPSILEELMDKDSDIVLPVDTKPCDEEAMKVSSENGKIRYISKKLDVNKCDGEFIGVAKINNNVIPALKEKTIKLLRDEAFSEYFEAALQCIFDEGSFSADMIETGSRFWAEIDFLEDYKNAESRIVPELYDF